jgi:CHRD domain
MPVVAVRRLLAVLALAVVVAVVATAPAGAQTATKCTAFAVLKPGNEVPPAESRASGTTLVHINGTRLSFATIIANPGREMFFVGHIHPGAAGVNGPPLITLFNGPDTDRRLFTQFESIEIPEAQATAVCGNLAGHYVNYHTRAFPGGAIRGQLTRLF